MTISDYLKFYTNSTLNIFLFKKYFIIFNSTASFFKEFQMEIKISDLTVEEFKKIISTTVQETIEDYLEDLKALSSKDYISSIREAREDYKAGEFKNFDESF